MRKLLVGESDLSLIFENDGDAYKMQYMITADVLGAKSLVF